VGNFCTIPNSTKVSTDYAMSIIGRLLVQLEVVEKGQEVEVGLG
jgi:hypothetical protein